MKVLTERVEEMVERARDDAPEPRAASATADARLEKRDQVCVRFESIPFPLHRID